jgi:hypothetical protein
LKGCEKWTLAHVQLAKNADGFIDLEVPLGTSAGRPIGNKKAKLARLTKRVQASINKCLTDVSANLLSSTARRAMKDGMSCLWKQEEKFGIEKERVAMKKRKEDFMILSADTSGMDP